MISEQERQRILEYLNATSKSPVKKRRVRAITVNPASRWLPKIRIEVGRRYADLEPGAPVEEVLAIFESVSFLVCTKTRGAGVGAPFFFSREDVRKIEYDDPPAASTS